jgi:hypothetical protein
MSECIDPSNQIQQNVLRSSSGPQTNANGEFTLNKIDVFSKELTANIVSDAQTNPVVIAVGKYGESFYSSLSLLNNTFINTDATRLRLDEFPSLTARLESSTTISAIEFADFLDQYGYNPRTLTTKSGSNSQSVLFELDDYYGRTIKTGALASLCNTFQSIFGAVDGFFALLGEISDLVSLVLEKVIDFKNFLANAAEQAVILVLINEIKKRIKAEIDKILSRIEAIITNLINSISQTLQNISTFIDETTIRGIMKQKDDTCLIFSEDNKSKIRAIIIGAFDRAVSLFENPSIAQVEFFIARICSFLTNIEALFNDVTTPMKQFEFKYTRIANRLTTISNITTSTALRAGAIRYSPEVKRENINKIKSQWEGKSGQVLTPNGTIPINPPRPSVDEFLDIPSCSSIFSGSSSTIGVDGESFKDELLGMQGYTGLDYSLRVYLVRMSKDLGKKIIITFGWVSQEYNSAVFSSPESPHLSGLCVNVTTNDFDADVLKQAAFRAGFRTAKSYDDYIHLDVRTILGA